MGEGAIQGVEDYGVALTGTIWLFLWRRNEVMLVERESGCLALPSGRLGSGAFFSSAVRRLAYELTGSYVRWPAALGRVISPELGALVCAHLTEVEDFTGSDETTTRALHPRTEAFDLLSKELRQAVELQLDFATSFIG